MPLLQHMHLLQAWLRGRDYTFLITFYSLPHPGPPPHSVCSWRR